MVKTQLPVPAKVFDEANAVLLGMTRSGKSSTCRDCVEFFADRGDRWGVLTPKDDWWGVKLGADGKSPGLAAVLFGGEYADVPINDLAGKQIAELVATGHRPFVITVSDLSVEGRARFFIDFAETLWKLNRDVLHLVIDECHNFAPKGKLFDPLQAKMLHWANRLASEGLGRGINLLSASQRPQKVHNDFLTSHEMLIAKKVTHGADRKALREWIDGCGDLEVGKELMASVAGLAKPDAWVWHPGANFGPKRVAFPMFRTFDSFNAKARRKAGKLKGWASVDLADVKEKLASYVKEAEARDPAKLQAEVRRLTAELAKAQKATPAAPAPTTAPAGMLAAAVKEARAEAVRTFRAQLAAEFGKIIEKADKEFADGIGHLADKMVSDCRDDFQKALQRVRGRIGTLPLGAAPPPAAAPAAPRVAIAPPAPAIPFRPAPAESADGLAKGPSIVLRAILQFGPMERDQLTVLTGYKKTSRNTYVEALARQGLIVTSPALQATAAGVAALPDFEPLPTGAKLVEYWKARLPSGEWKVLEAIIAAYPNAIARTAVQESTGYAKTSTNTYIEKLAARRLVKTSPGSIVQASAILFD